ncbi:MAG: ABC transporter permease [Bacteroidetes bacterium]|nr:ABC transporter permease [Bacteroidota bacterium]
MHRPPQICEFIVRLVLHDVDRAAVLGDLHETYSALREHYGRREAARWYRSQVIRSIPFIFHRSIFWGLTMLHNYILVALRTIRKHKGYSFINVTGLAAGLSCFLFIALFIQHERSYDRFHSGSDRIYRVELDLENPTGTNELATSPGALSPLLNRSLPEIEVSTRLFRPSQITIATETDTYKETKTFFADPALADVFDLVVLRGDLSGLSRPNGMVLTEEAATKYFKSDAVVGQTLLVADSLTVEVTGIVQSFPSNSHFQFDVLISMDTWKRVMPATDTRWSPHMFHTYALVSPAANVESMKATLDQLIRENVQLGDGWWFNFQFTPLTDIHLTSHRIAELDVNRSVDSLYLFGIIAVFILAVACVNFMNLSTARSSMRTREIGMRKVLGARRAQLVGQFLGEAYLFTALAVLVSVGIVILGLTWFNSVAGTTISAASLLQGPFLISILLAILLVGLLAGAYPAFFLSGFRPISALKGWASSQTGHRSESTLRKSLVVFQFAVSIFLIAGTGIVLDQLSFMRSADKGFEPEQVFVISSLSARDHTAASAYAHQISSLASVESTTMSNAVPGRETIGYSFRVPSMEESEWQVIPVLFTDADFMEVFDVELAAGRDFSWDYRADSSGSIMLNEAAVASVGWKPSEAIGREFFLRRGGTTIVGVLKDFNYRSLHNEVEPMAFLSTPIAYGSAPLFLSIRLTGANMAETTSALESEWKNMLPNKPFEYFFLNEDYDRQYREDERLARIFTVFGGLAILIACLGLFGLATLAAEQRMKEIGIRKALGATTYGIAAMFTANFMKLVGLAILLGIPVTWFAAKAWLENFAYRTGIGLDVFLYSAFILATIAAATITIQSIRAALSNPVDALRYE